MSEFSRLDILQSLKKDRLLESKSIVIFTASSDRKLLDEIKNSGRDVEKTLSLDELITLIERYLPLA